MRAEHLDLLGDLQARARGRALERHVLEEMRDAAVGRRLVAGAGIHKNADSGRIEARQPGGDDAQPVIEDTLFNVHGGSFALTVNT